MAYINPFSYNRDSSVDSKYEYTADLVKFKPIYGSSVSFSSRLNYLQTVDNTLKILPVSENNLVAKYNLKFLLNDQDTGDLLKTIEIAGGYKYLKFIDPSNLYKDMMGLVEDYSVSKSSQNLNEVNIIVSSYFKSPMFNWRTSSFFNVNNSNIYSGFKDYDKYDFVYFDDGAADNKIDNFYFAKNKITAVNKDSFNGTLWTKKFIFEPKLPFELKNKFDIYQLDYKNSFIQNIKHKENSNTLKEYTVKFENIDNKQCLSILLYFEKKCGYRRFIYDFPFLLKKAKVFICKDWIHTFKYSDCNDVTATFVEDPNPDISNLNLDGQYDSNLYSAGINYIFVDGKLYVETSSAINLFATGPFALFYQPTNKYYSNGVPANTTKSIRIIINGKPVSVEFYFIDGVIADGIDNVSTVSGAARKYDLNGLVVETGFRYYFSNNFLQQKYNGAYLHGSPYDVTVTGYEGEFTINGDAAEFNEKEITLFLYNNILYRIPEDGLGLNKDSSGNFTENHRLFSSVLDGFTGVFNKLYYYRGALSTLSSLRLYPNTKPVISYIYGYPTFNISFNNDTNKSKAVPLVYQSAGQTNPQLYLVGEWLAIQNSILSNRSPEYIIFSGNQLLYYGPRRHTGIYEDKYYFNGKLATASNQTPSSSSFFYINGDKLDESDTGTETPYENYFYKYGYKVISNGNYDGFNFINGVKQV
jgi:phage-related protein